MRLALALALAFASAGCFPTADPLGYRLCEAGASPCPSGQSCQNGLCQPRPEAAREGADLNGTVTRGSAGSPVPIPVAGAVVEVAGAGLFAQTDENGAFRIRAIPAGAHQLIVLTPTGSDLAEPRFEGPQAGSFALTVDDADLGGTLQKDLVLNRRGDLAGRLVLADRDPFAEVHGGAVVFVPGIPSAGDITGPDGVFLITGLPEGAHQVVVESAEHGPFEFSAQVDALARNWIIQSDPVPAVNSSLSRRIAGRIDTPAGGLDSGLQLRAMPIFGAGRQVVTLEDDGGFDFALGAPGPYALVLRGDGWRPAQISGVVAGQNDITLRAIAVEGGDLDEDGVVDAEDADRDGDGCLDVDDAMPDDPRGCGDRDHDGLPDDLDNDDECDGASDTEEARPGLDGVVTDHQQVDHTENGGVVVTQGDFAAMSADGILRVVSATGTAQITDPAAGFRYVVDPQQDALIYGPYRLQLDPGDGALVQLFIASHPAEDGDELQLLRRPAGCTAADCTLSERPRCVRSGYRNWLRCSHDLTVSGVVDELVWVRQARRPLNRIADFAALQASASPFDRGACLAITSETPVYALFHRQIAVWRGEFRLVSDDIGIPHMPSCYASTPNPVEGCIVAAIRDDDGDALVITDWRLEAQGIGGIGQVPIEVINGESSNPSIRVTHVLPGIGHRLIATISDGISEPQEVTIELSLVGLSASLHCWTN